MNDLIIPALMFPALFALIFLGFPVSFSLIATAIAFGLPVFGFRIGAQSFQFIETVASNYVLAAIPLFVLMGSMLERSGIAERLYFAMRVWLGRLPGGLAVATIAMAAIFAAATGIVGAVETLIGMMAIPPMMRVKYDRGLIAGTICAGGSLGTIIPPSIVVVIYASVAQLSIGKLMVGIIIPGLAMVFLFIAYIIIRCTFRPSDGPGLETDQLKMSWAEKIYLLLTALLPALALVVAVIGSMLAGIASPTEAAGVGVVATLALTLVYRTFNWKMLIEALHTTVTVTAMITLIIVGGTMFTSIFRVSGGGRLVNLLIDALNLQPAGMIVLFLFIIFVLGFILDWVSIVLITIPIFAPIIKAAGVDPLWFGVMAIVVIQTSYLTPPMAPAIFYLRAVAPPEMTYTDMYWGIIPFVICQLLSLALVALWPPAATYLANVLIGF